MIYQPRGTVNAQDIHNYINDVLHDPNFTTGMSEYIDVSEVEDWLLDHSEVEKIVLTDQNQSHSIKGVLKTGIWAPKEVAFGMARMYQILAAEYHANIFISKDKKSVLEYLGITETDLFGLY